ncbi:FadR/GntR family transcriptional regulator [Martelella alba]|uniref:FadR family transcriptional regulator n=1 Tax=Martelella alba TaxID=2590451 RepID=A0ABY2SQ73_9HYPH|nr:FCD domain-containing protein [Martelella alba]TKI07817.1 FadR family transcriptional regulator [Martelella alba]
MPAKHYESSKDLIDHIVALLSPRLAAGETLPSERALVEELGVKRYALRKALEQLRGAGLLSAAATGRAKTSLKASQKNLAQITNPLEVIELRLLIEPMLVRLAAVRASQQDIDRILRTAAMAGSHDNGKVDLAFHKQIAAASSNRLAAELYGLLRQIGSDVRLRIQKNDEPLSPDRLTTRNHEHGEIARAIAQRNPDAAEKAMRHHLFNVQRQILNHLVPQPQEAPMAELQDENART